MIGAMAGSVLVVDDDPEFRQLAGRLLAASGLTVVGEADSVAAALAAAARLEPSAILLDVELPDGDGVTLARELAALPWAPAGPAHLDRRDITTSDEARNAGARSCTKPSSRTHRLGSYSAAHSSGIVTPVRSSHA
jgi:CheY-like chemotaxis protein